MTDASLVTQLQPVIDAAWDARDTVNVQTKGEVRDAVDATLEALDNGKLRVAEKIDGAWTVHQWAKKAVLLSFRLTDNMLISDAPGGAHWFDKVPSKFAGWSEQRFRSAGFRAVPGEIGSAHVWTPATNAHLVCRLLLEKQKKLKPT